MDRSKSPGHQRPLDLKVRDSLFEPGTSDRKVYLDNEKPDLVFYRVWLFLEGRDLPYVSRVTYHLHETFRDPVRVVPRTASNPNCALDIWTWGVFRVLALVEDKRGSTVELSHKLTYANQLKEDLEYKTRPVRK
jgi:hypothetical protein